MTQSVGKKKSIAAAKPTPKAATKVVAKSTQAIGKNTPKSGAKPGAASAAKSSATKTVSVKGRILSAFKTA